MTSLKRHRITAAILLPVGLLLLFTGIVDLGYFEAAQADALAYPAAPQCEVPGLAGCASRELGEITNKHTVTGRSTSYYFTVTAPHGAATQSNTSHGEYSRLALGQVVTVTEWKGAIMTVIPDDGGGPIETDQNPHAVLTNATFGLVLLVMGVGALAWFLLTFLSPLSPDDVVRNTVAEQPSPPRLHPSGILRAVVADRAGTAALWVMVTQVFAILGFIILIRSSPAQVGAAPTALILLMLIVAALAFWWLHMRVVRDLTSGVAMAIPVTSETILRGKSGAYGIRARYRINDGTYKSIKITRKWWRQVHPATRLNAIGSPSDGKIWRLLGMTDDNGNRII